MADMFSVMNINFGALQYEFILNDNTSIFEHIKRKIKDEKPDIILIQGIQQVQNLDSIIQQNDLFYSHYSRSTKRGYAAVMASAKTFEIEILSREHLKHGKPEDRRNLFNGLSCVQLYHKKLNYELLVSSWDGNPSAVDQRTDESFLLTTLMKRTSNDRPWLIGGCFTDSKQNIESKFLVGINKTSKQKLFVENVTSSSVLDDETRTAFPVTAHIRVLNQF